MTTTALDKIQSMEDAIADESDKIYGEYLLFCVKLVANEGEEGAFDSNQIRIETIKAGKSLEDFKVDIRKLSARKKAIADLTRAEELRSEKPAMREKLDQLKLDYNNKYKLLEVELNHLEKDISVKRESIMQKMREAAGLETQAWRLLKDTALDPDKSGDWRMADLKGAPRFAENDPRSKLPICF